jgi:multiple sugar transport system permease protein
MSGLAVAKRKRRRGDFWVAVPFMLPALAGLIGFVIIPGVRGIILSFSDYNVFTGDLTFTGFANYIRMVKDPHFLNSFLVTGEYVLINIGIQTVLSLFIAVLLHRFTRSHVIKGVLLLPYLISNVIVAMVWYWLLDYNLGLINSVFDTLSVHKFTFFSEQTAMPSIALINVWRHMGYTALLIFAGLQAIPRDVYEAASIDGASEWRLFRSVTLPLLRPVMAFVLVITITGSFQIFDTIAVTTKGGPVIATDAYSIWIAREAWGNNDFGFASAISVFLMVLLSVIAFLQTRLLSANQSDLDR